MKTTRRILVSLLVLASLGACGSDSDDDAAATTTSTPPTTLSAEQKQVQERVRAAVEAENAKDSKTFLAMWTDKGLESYDIGSRAEVEAGKSENFGSDKVTIVDLETPEVTGTTAT